MSRIDLNEPYTSYLQSLVNAGIYRSITAAAEAAIHKQMIEDEKLRLSSIGNAIAKGEADIQAGRTIKYTHDMMNGISEKGKAAALKKQIIKPDVQP